MRGALFLVCLSTSSSLIACAVAAPEPGSDPAVTESTATAMIVVERTSGPNDAVRGDAVVARFVRVSQGTVDDPALRIAGVAPELPAAGACFIPTDGSIALATSSSGRDVELLDVGQVTLSAPHDDGDHDGALSQQGAELAVANIAKSTVLVPRSMPDPAGVVSGIFYSSRSADVFVPGARMTLRANGSADLLDGFNVTVSAPRDVADVHVAPGAVGLDVVWDAADANPRDLVYVDLLSPAGSTPRVVLRCTSSDTGHVTVPVRADDGQVAVHRIHRESFKAKGIEPGEVRFDLAKVVNFHH